MNEILISIETARLAQQKGLNIIGDYYYTPDTEVLMHSIWFTEDKVYHHGEIPAMTQTIVSKWLREVHGIHITVYWNGDKNYDYSIKTDPTKILNHVKHCESYEIALEQALVESLNLIK